MKTNNAFTKKDLYFTDDHEWIDFQGSVAYTGICKFKLTGFKAIQKIAYIDATGFKQKGEILATIRYNDYLITAHMPVAGKIIQLNEHFVKGDCEDLLHNPEGSGWLALIGPSQPYERRGLLLPKDYRPNGKGKYAKS